MQGGPAIRQPLVRSLFYTSHGCGGTQAGPGVQGRGVGGAERGWGFLFKVQDHGGWVLQVGLPQIGEPAHGGAVDDPMVRRPAHVHDVGLHHLVLRVEPGQHLRTNTASQVRPSVPQHGLTIRLGLVYYSMG